MILSRIPNVNSARLKDFLNQKGWLIKDSDRVNEIATAYSPADNYGNRLAYFLPQDKTDDFKILVSHIFNGLSIVENCDYLSSIDEFVEFAENNYVINQSSMKFRFGGNVNHNISLIAFEDIAKHSRAAIAHSIANEEELSVYRTDRVSKTATSLSRKFEVGHTQKGSYIIVLKTPTEHIQETFSGFEDAPHIQTKSVIRILKGMDWVSNNFDKVDNYQEVLKACQAGLNANMALHLLLLFKSAGSTERSISFNVNATVLKKEGIERLSFPVRSKELYALNKIYELLSEPKEVSLQLSVRIIALASDNPLQEKLSHEITVTIVQPGSPFHGKNMSFELSKGHYTNAIRIHEAAKLINIEGVFEVAGNKITLAELTRFDF